MKARFEEPQRYNCGQWFLKVVYGPFETSEEALEFRSSIEQPSHEQTPPPTLGILVSDHAVTREKIGE